MGLDLLPGWNLLQPPGYSSLSASTSAPGAELAATRRPALDRHPPALGAFARRTTHPPRRTGATGTDRHSALAPWIHPAGSGISRLSRRPDLCVTLLTLRQDAAAGAADQRILPRRLQRPLLRPRSVGTPWQLLALDSLRRRRPYRTKRRADWIYPPAVGGEIPGTFPLFQLAAVAFNGQDAVRGLGYNPPLYRWRRIGYCTS